ncbi:hypothetical protein [Chryseobacterium luquanense]|uniref:Uncharacterized protein n=1 Tax=Chryseobacterium luquanense TaxID=2983766 RepID=A0ABT3Y3M5_9FLAO|nr:hypothetical protein [Chryseobacterium luquanense]MCX8532681.1 hypothetical protein [Chryseobacterium luquanense]
MKKGEIYRLREEFKKHYNTESFNHPFVFWENEGININGIMITCSSIPKYSNKEFEEYHFEKGYEIGFGKSDKYPKSYFAPLYLLKKVKFDHLEKVGKLTQGGINHLEIAKDDLEYTDWETHMLKD